MNKKQSIAFLIILLSMFLQITYPAVVQAAPLIPDEFEYDGKLYQYDQRGKNDEQTLETDLDYNGINETVISFLACIKIEKEEKGEKRLRPFYQIYKNTGGGYKLIETIKGSKYSDGRVEVLGKMSIEDFSKDRRKQLVLRTVRAPSNTNLYIYEWRDGGYKRIFEVEYACWYALRTSGEACWYAPRTSGEIPEIWVGWHQQQQDHTGDLLQEMYKWDGKGFAKNGAALSMAYWFEDYEWGKSWDEIKAKVEKRNASVNVDTEASKLGFKDKVFDRDCKVTLCFAPKSRLLWAVEIRWGDINAVGSIKERLIKQYGEPEKKDYNSKNYEWDNSTNETCLGLQYSNNGTVLVYFYAKHTEMFEREAKELYKPPLK